MKKLIAAAAAATVMALTPTSAFAGKDTAPGQVIKTECGASYGQIVSSFTPGFSQGQHAKGAGLKPGAYSFVNTEGSLAIHGCVNGNG